MSARRGASTLLTNRSIRSSSWTVPTKRRSSESRPRINGRIWASTRSRSGAGNDSMLRPAKGALTAIAHFDVGGGSIDDLQRGFVAALVVVAPGAHPVVAEEHALGLRMLLDETFDSQPDVEPGPLPRHVDDVVAVDLPAEPLLVDRRGDGDDGVGMQMIDVSERHECVQRRVDRARARVQIEHAMAVHRIHRIFDWRFRTAVRSTLVDLPHGADLVEIERRESVTLSRTQVTARPFHPEDLHLLACEWIALEQLGRRVSTARVRERQVLAQLVGSVDQAIEAVESLGVLVLPQIAHVLQVARRLGHDTGRLDRREPAGSRQWDPPAAPLSLQNSSFRPS